MSRLETVLNELNKEFQLMKQTDPALTRRADGRSA
jgi:hypothetical protein